MAWEPDYAEVADLTAYVRVDDDDDDVWAQGAITAASRAIDQATRRQFGKVEVFEQRRYRPRAGPRGCWVVDMDDLADDAGLLVNGDPADPLNLEPLVRPTGRPYTRLHVASCAIQTLGSDAWGWEAVPATVHTACLLQASRFLVRRDSPYGIAGSPDSAAGEVRLLAKLDPDVALMLRGYIRRAVPR